MTDVQERRRVAATIGATVLAFCRSREGQSFHADELRRFVAAQHPTAPASADRILRLLRAAGHLGYDVLNRRQSLYVVRWVAAVQGRLAL